MGSLREENFWDEHYALELKNYDEDGDEGDIWFGKKLSRDIIKWIIQKIQSDSLSGNITIIDIGCGNAFLLCELAEKLIDKSKFSPTLSELELLGLDYSVNSIKLSDKIVAAKNLQTAINLKQCDFLDQEQLISATCHQKYDFILDKGTYDAICLLAEDCQEKLMKSKQAYLKSLYSLVKPDSIFVIVSCNNTKDELLALITTDSEHKVNPTLIDEIVTPTLQFGGKTGSQVTCLIFKFTM